MKITNKYLRSVNQDIAAALAMFQNPKTENKADFFGHIQWQVRDAMLRGASVRFVMKSHFVYQFNRFHHLRGVGLNLGEVLEITLVK